MVLASDNSNLYNGAGAVTIGRAQGYGITIVLNNITRKTKAIIGNEEQLLGSGTFAPGVGVDDSDLFTPGYAHGFANDDIVVYTSGGDFVIGGLFDGQQYIIGNATTTSFQLGRTATEFTTTAEFSPTTAIDVADDAIDLGYVHQFQLGDAIVYRNGGDVDIDGLVDGETYYVIPLSTTEIALAKSLRDALQKNRNIFAPFLYANGDNDQIVFPFAHELTTGQPVVYDNGNGTDFGDLIDSQVVYAVAVVIDDIADDNAIQLAPTAADAIAGTNLLSLDPSNGQGESHSLQPGFYPQSALDTASDTIDLGYEHDMETGQAVRYDALGGVDVLDQIQLTELNGDPIDFDLTDAESLFFLRGQLQLSLDITGIAADDVQVIRPDRRLAIDPGSTAAPAHGFRLTVDPTRANQPTHAVGMAFDPETAVDADSIDLGYSHGFTSGDRIIYSAGEGIGIDGLGHGNEYFAVVLDSQTIQLAKTLEQALKTVPVVIDLDATDATGTLHAVGLAMQTRPLIDSSTDVIDFERPHGFETGDEVVYRDGIEGTIVILDTSEFAVVNNKRVFLETTYTRIGNTVTAALNGTPFRNPIILTGLSGGIDAQYSVRNTRYIWTTQDSFARERKWVWNNRNNRRSVDEIMANGNLLIDETGTIITEAGEYSQTGGSCACRGFYDYIFTERSVSIVDGGITLFVVIRHPFTFVTKFDYKLFIFKGQQRVHKHSVHAGQPIDIEFIGDSHGSVNVELLGSVILSGQIAARGGTVTINAGAADGVTAPSAKNIEVLTSTPPITANSFSLNATGTIGSGNSVELWPTELGGDNLSAVVYGPRHLFKVAPSLTRLTRHLFWKSGSEVSRSPETAFSYSRAWHTVLRTQSPKSLPPCSSLNRSISKQLPRRRSAAGARLPTVAPRGTMWAY